MAHAVADAMEVMQANFLHRFNSLVPLPLWIPTPANLRMRRALKKLNAVLFGIISERRRQSLSSPPRSRDLLSLLLGGG